MLEFKVNDQVKFFDSADSSIPVYGTISRITPKGYVVTTSFGSYTLWNRNEHIHMLNFN